jgi:hypothetical protein
MAQVRIGDELDTLRTESRNPPVENLGLAAKYMHSILQRLGIKFAFFGGWAVYLRGGPRKAQGLDIVISTAGDMQKYLDLQEYLRGQSW